MRQYILYRDDLSGEIVGHGLDLPEELEVEAGLAVLWDVAPVEPDAAHVVEGQLVWRSPVAQQAYVDLQKVGTIVEHIEAERARRVGQQFYFMGHRFHLGEESKLRLLASTTQAQAYLAQPGADPETFDWLGTGKPFRYITADGARVEMTAPMCYAMGVSAMAWEQAHLEAAQDLIDSPTPVLDYDDDSHWPASMV